MTDLDTITIKATQGAVTRRTQFKGPPTLESLTQHLSHHFTITPDAHVTYKDEDGDDISFSTDAEVQEQIALASNTSNKVVRLQIVTSESVPTSPPPTPQLDALITNISDLVTVIRGAPSQPLSQPPAKRACVRGLKPDSKFKTERAVAIKQGMFSGLRPLLSALPSKKNLRPSMTSIEKETRTSFKDIASVIKKSPQRKKLLSGLTAATPALREFIADLPDKGLPTVERVQVFVTAVEASVKGTDDAVVTKISDFIMTAASDPALVDCLRKVKDVPVMPWEPGFIKSVRTSRGFDIHQVTCAGCKKSPIVGTRYECKSEGFSACGDCHVKQDLTQGHAFVERKYVWEKNYEGRKVPPPPLRSGERGNKVKFLHKVLTDLGFMNSRMYARRPGVFSDNTKKAVAAFQAENNIRGEAGVYDNITAERLMQVVIEREMAADNGTGAMDVVADVAMKA